MSGNYLDAVLSRVSGAAADAEEPEGSEDYDGFHSRREPDGGLSPGTKRSPSAPELAAEFLAKKWGRL